MKIKSSMIKSVDYNSLSRTLEIEFNNGALYKYDHVPQEIYNGIIKSQSVGGYFHSTIKNNFTASKVK